MPRYLVRQPNGKYAEWTTVSDEFVFLNLTEEEVIDAWIAEQAEEDRIMRETGDAENVVLADYKELLKDKASWTPNEIADEKYRSEFKKGFDVQVRNINGAGTAWDWANNWDELIEDFESDANEGWDKYKDMLEEIDRLGIPRRMDASQRIDELTAEKYWHELYKTKYIHEVWLPSLLGQPGR